MAIEVSKYVKHKLNFCIIPRDFVIQCRRTSYVQKRQEKMNLYIAKPSENFEMISYLKRFSSSTPL